MTIGVRFDDGFKFVKKVADTLELKNVESAKLSASANECIKVEVSVLLTPEQVKKIMGE